MKRLITLQQRLKVTKDKSGYGFKYRDAEAILEAAKPILEEVNCAIVTTTNLEEHLGRIYYNCTVKLISIEGNTLAEASAQVEDPHEMIKGKNKMETQQVSGSNITYAKRYALQNLLAIDNGDDDPDAISKETNEQKEQDEKNKGKGKGAAAPTQQQEQKLPAWTDNIKDAASANQFTKIWIKNEKGVSKEAQDKNWRDLAAKAQSIGLTFTPETNEWK